jgi:hypothetical protein
VINTKLPTGTENLICVFVALMIFTVFAPAAPAELSQSSAAIPKNNALVSVAVCVT